MKADAKSEPRVLVDAGMLGEGGSASVPTAAPSSDGKWVAYAVARAGSEYQEVFVKEAKTGREAADRLGRLRQPGLAWAKDGKGFYYSNHPALGAEGEGAPGPKLFFHRLGEPPEKDRVVFEASDREALVRPLVSDDGAWLVITAGKGGEAGPHEVHAADLRRGGEVKPFALLKNEGHAYRPVEVVDERLVLITGKDAPRGRVAAVDLRKAAAAKAGGEPTLEELVPQPADGVVVRTAAVAGRKLLVETLEKAKSVLSVYDLKGKAEGKVALPGAGALASLSGRASDPEALVEYASFTEPRAAYGYNVAKKELKPIFKASPKFDPSSYVVEQVSYPLLKEGARATMFLVHRKDVNPDGSRLTYLRARGPVREALVPEFDPAAFLLLERGGVLAVPNLRGGFESGEPWRSAGPPVDERAALDDLIGAARWLSARRVTRPARTVVGGGAGGPLVAAAIVERPELFGAALPRSPLADMLRYPKLGAGARRVGEWGDPSEAGPFAALYAYSPYHRAARGGDYPPLLITAGARDDAAPPGHARKLAARLQATGAGDEPLLLRIGPGAGQGGEVPLGARLDEEADRWTFVFWRIGTPEQAPLGKARPAPAEKEEPAGRERPATPAAEPAGRGPTLPAGREKPPATAPTGKEPPATAPSGKEKPPARSPTPPPVPSPAPPSEGSGWDVGPGSGSAPANPPPIKPGAGATPGAKPAPPSPPPSPPSPPPPGAVDL